jgi:hypothetical protein
MLSASSDTVSMTQFEASRAFAETDMAVKWFTVTTFTVPFGAIGNESLVFRREYFANTVHITRQTIEVVGTIRFLPYFFADNDTHNILSFAVTYVERL